MEEAKKQLFKPKFLSEFSMGELDFKRYDKWLERSDLSSASINSTMIPDIEQIQMYFSELNVMYKNWKELISSPKIVEELDALILKCKKSKRTWELNIGSGIQFSVVNIHRLVDDLDELHTKLLKIKQIIGLGIVTKRVFTTKEKINRGMRQNKMIGDLPEA